MELAGLARAEGAAALKAREDRWRPVAQRVSEWLAEARPAQEGLLHVRGLEKAEKWIRETQSDIRDERFEPIAERAREIESTSPSAVVEKIVVVVFGRRERDA
jgi:hypothetical protein